MALLGLTASSSPWPIPRLIIWSSAQSANCTRVQYDLHASASVEARPPSRPTNSDSSVLAHDIQKGNAPDGITVGEPRHRGRLGRNRPTRNNGGSPKIGGAPVTRTKLSSPGGRARARGKQTFADDLNELAPTPRSRRPQLWFRAANHKRETPPTASRGGENRGIGGAWVATDQQQRRGAHWSWRDPVTRLKLSTPPRSARAAHPFFARPTPTTRPC